MTNDEMNYNTSSSYGSRGATKPASSINGNPLGPEKNHASVKNIASDAGADVNINDEYGGSRSSQENQFEDDEDLYKMEQDRTADMFINGQQNAAANINDDIWIDDNSNTLNHARTLLESQLLDSHSMGASDPTLSSVNTTNDDWSTLAKTTNDPDGNNHESFRHLNTWPLKSNINNNKTLANLSIQDNGIFDFVDSFDSTRLRFVMFFHNHMLPAESLNCYLGFGEHYIGNISQSSDRRLCANWLQVKRTRIGISHKQPRDQSSVINNNHNFCRNPNSDPRGPWCFVRYNDELDRQAADPTSGSPSQPVQRVRFIARPCAISACSSYLWLYIVAPPLGLLLILILLIVLSIRSLRRSHYRRCIRSMGKTFPAIHKISFLSQNSFKDSRTSRCERYLDDDVFEIVDDIDYSDCHASSSTSPKSVESLKLSSSSSALARSTNQMDANKNSQQTTAMRLANHIFDSKLVDSSSEIAKRRLENHASTRFLAAQSNGPIFATLRCNMQNSSLSTSGFRSRLDPKAPHKSNVHNGSKQILFASSSDSSSASLATSPNGKQLNSCESESDKLISCSTTLDDIGPIVSEMDSQAIKPVDLPLIEQSSVSIEPNRELIFEGKFIQVQMAYLKQKSAPRYDTEDKRHLKEPDVMLSKHDIGKQVAVHSLKPTASTGAIDPTVFDPKTLKLKNLNHLNITKLIGYIQYEDRIAHKSCQCSLVYDMSQLVDFCDWLKQRNSDSIVSHKDPSEALRLRRNLTCLAKQLALAVDYLHDRDIVYRDLGCRNCFIDPTKMLVKLASFNHELTSQQSSKTSVSDSSDPNLFHLQPMIRPKYLLDYYVIDSRPSNCQMLPLSWIPLESILFNKFSKQTDIWSFGCLLYELFSLGEVAYFGYSCKQVIDAVRSNLMPPQPSLCPNGVYNIMCKCLSDIPTNRPNIKQIYEQLNLYSGQCSSFLDHHLCSLATIMYDDLDTDSGRNLYQGVELAKPSNEPILSNRSINRTKSYANIRQLSPSSQKLALETSKQNIYDNIIRPHEVELSNAIVTRDQAKKIPLSKSSNLVANK